MTKPGYYEPFYWLGGPKALGFFAARDDADIYYAERNGDQIGIIVPKGAKYETLPKKALNHVVDGLWERC